MHDNPSTDAVTDADESARREFDIISRSLTPSIPRTAEFTSIRVTLPPGSIGSPPHRHSSPAFGYVLRGELRFEIEGARERVIAAGGSFWEPGGETIHWREANNLVDEETTFVVMTFSTPGQPMSTLVSEAELQDRLARRVPRPE